jgi:hypothetical protein
LAALAVVVIVPAAQGEIRGTYIESRTCQVYTGPCFANGEVGAAGRNAIMAWDIQDGAQDGVDLSGLRVIVVIDSSETIGFGGLKDHKKLKSVILVDEEADTDQRDALIAFARKHSGRAGDHVVRIDDSKIAMKLDVSTLKGDVEADKGVKISTRKARLDDCICSNESAYYPPLTKLKNFVPGVTLEGSYQGRGLGARWSTPGDRSAYMAIFKY